MLEKIAESQDPRYGRRNFVKIVGIGSAGVFAFGLTSESDARIQSATKLEAKIDNHIKKLRQEGKIEADEKTAWSVYDFTLNQKLVSINEELPFQAASMVKPLIALAFFHEVKNGRLKYDEISRVQLEASIQRSSNPATKWIIRRIGGPEKVQQILKENYGKILKNVSIAEDIPRDGRTYKNKASARDYSRFLYALWNDRLPYSEELKELMVLKKRNRIYDGTKVPEGTIVIDKTGSTGMLCGDMGILVVKDKSGKMYPYTVIGIIERDSRTNDYRKWIKSRGEVIREISNIAYDYMKVRHKL